MDRLRQADAILAAALAHSPSAVVPGRALSPMDCDITIPVTRTVVRACDRRARGQSDDARPDYHGGRPVLDEEMARLSRGAAVPRPRAADRSA